MFNTITANTTSTMTAQVEETLNLLAATVASDPHGADAKIGAREIVRLYGVRVEGAVRTIIRHAEMAHDAKRSVDAFQNDYTPAGCVAWNRAFEYYSNHIEQAEQAATEAAAQFLSVADLI